MQTWARSLFGGIGGLAAVGLLVAAAATGAQAAPKSRQVETEAKFVKFNPEDSTVTVTVIKPGKSVKGMPKLKRGKEAVFRVEPEGSVLQRTTVKLKNGTAGGFEDLEEGRKVKLFWVPDPKDETARFARSISVFVPAEDQGVDAD